MIRYYADQWKVFIEHCGFTDAEMEVIALLQRGWYGADIAAELNISLSTVKRRKAGIKNRIKRYLEESSRWMIPPRSF